MTTKDAQWLLGRREEAKAALQGFPMPDRAAHRFRFTDPERLWPSDGLPVSPTDIEVRADGAIAGTFPDTPREALDALSEFLGRLAGPEDRFLAFNLASFTSGAVVVIPPGAHVADPIRIRTRIVQKDPGQVVAVRHLIVLGRDARARVYESLWMESGLLNGVTEFVVADGAHLEHARVVEPGPEATGFWHTRTALHRDASLRRVQAVAPGRLWKDEVVTVLAAPGAHANESVLIRTDWEAHADQRIVADHAAPNAQSRVTVRAVASGQGRAVFTGLLRVREGASGSEAYEEARGLILSHKASADLLPELEILNHDVRASHGAAVGPLDEEARHYLMTRGISREEAEAMLVRGFTATVLDAMPAEMVAGRPWAVLVGSEEE